MNNTDEICSSAYSNTKKIFLPFTTKGAMAMMRTCGPKAQGQNRQHSPILEHSQILDATVLFPRKYNEGQHL